VESRASALFAAIVVPQEAAIEFGRGSECKEFPCTPSRESLAYLEADLQPLDASAELEETELRIQIAVATAWRIRFGCCLVQPVHLGL
jgi:hypothetical protein